jgi:hypothetical protein
MYTIVTKIGSSEIDLAWLSENSQLSDGVLVCQHEDTVVTFDEFNDTTHTITEVSSLPENFSPETHQLVNGEIVLV